MEIVPSRAERQEGVKASFLQFLEQYPRPAIGDGFEFDGQVWKIVGFDRRHLVNEAPRVLGAVMETHCVKCGARMLSALRAMRNPDTMCRDHRGSHNAGSPGWIKAGRAYVARGSLPANLLEHLHEVSTVTDRIEWQAFVESALHLVKRRKGQDVRAQRIRQTVRRMAKRGQLPANVTLTPTGFRFD